MTSKEEKPRQASNAARTQYEHRTHRHALIREGLLGSVEELVEGAPWFGGHIERDIQAWCDGWLLRNSAVEDSDTPAWVQAMIAVKSLRDSCSLPMVKLAEKALADFLGEDDSVERMRIYLACLNDREAAIALAARIVEDGGYRSGFSAVWQDATARGLLHGDRGSMDSYCAWGVAATKSDYTLITDYEIAGREIADEAKAAADAKASDLLAAVRGLPADDADFLRAVAEDRAEYWVPSKPEAIVVPLLPEGQTGARKELYKSWHGIDSVPLPIALRGDVGAHRRALVEQWPHAADLIDTVLTDLAAREEVRFKPTLLVGKPGTGKSSLARAICDELRLPVELFSMAGVHDAALMGTSAQWHSARETLPLQLIKRTKTASVAVIWDEAEKAGTDRHNGSPLDALLPMLEIDQARRYRDLALEVEVDLSWVSHFATANSLDGVPAPLRDRMRVLTMPEPTWQHIGALSRQIIRRLAKERGIDERWFEPLAADELDLVRSVWPGGSIRQLTRIVTTILDGRQQIMGRA
jgi:hypothetical protein